jgi:HlyD family secretion protein
VQSSPRNLLPVELAQHTVESLYAGHGSERPWIHWLLLTGVIGALASLPFLTVDVSVRASGLVRPVTERAELRPAVSGHIAEVPARDNDRVSAGQPLLVLHSRDLAEKLLRNQTLQTERDALIADLRKLTADPLDAPEGKSRALAGAFALPAAEVQTPALQADYTQFRTQLESYRLAETKARNEFTRYATLAAKGIASQQELDNTRYEVERLQAESRLLAEQARARWQARLRDEQTAQADLASEARQLREEQGRYTLRAPADGVLVGFTGWSPGGFVSAGQLLGAVSPEDTLQIETYVSPRDIGLVRMGQTARLQIDAYPYTQWGTLDGTVIAISGDLQSTAAAPAGSNPPVAFKVLVRPATPFLTLPNGVRGELKKGLTLSARFLVARRSVLQLLYDDASAWLDPQGGRGPL